jgi:purine-nucleoside phosphorylase
MAQEIENATVIPYAEVPHFPLSTAPGHAGELVLGTLEGQPVAALSGRAHLYEGYTPEQVVLPVRAMRLLGAEILLITNAAGGLDPTWDPGTLMLIADHLNLTGRNPLVGPNDARLGVRFPDLSAAYHPGLRAQAREAAAEAGVSVEEGVYAGLLGPSYETPAEIRMLRTLGADAVGMSTVMEVIAANHAGLAVLAISCITNLAAGLLPRELTEQEVIDTAARVRDTFAALVRTVIGRLGRDPAMLRV